MEARSTEFLKTGDLGGEKSLENPEKRRKRPFKSLRKQIVASLKRIRNTAPIPLPPPIFTSAQGDRLTTLSGRRFPGEGKMHSWNQNNALLFDDESRQLVFRIADEILAQPQIAAKVTREVVVETLIDACLRVCGANHSEIEVADEIVDRIVSADDRVHFVTPLLGLRPDGGVLAIGIFRILASTHPEAMTVLQRADFGGPFFDEGVERIEQIKREYRQHSIATTIWPVHMKPAVGFLREQLDYHLGAMVFCVLNSTQLEYDRFRFRANGECWSKMVHSLTGVPDGDLRPNLALDVNEQPVVVNTPTIPVIATRHFALLDRLLKTLHPPTELERRLRESLIWLRRAQDSTSVDETLLLAFVALETLFKCNLNKTDLVSQFVGLMVGAGMQDESKREFWVAELARLYSVRSEMVHAGLRRVTRDDAIFLISSAAMGFDLLAQLVSNLGLSNEHELYDWLVESLPAGPDIDRLLKGLLGSSAGALAVSTTKTGSDLIVNAMTERGWEFGVLREHSPSAVVSFKKERLVAEGRAGDYPLAVCRAALLAIARAGRTD